jgi:hypothetical protein
VYGGTVQGEILFCRQFEEHSTGKEIFNLTGAHFNEAKINWSLCTEGVRSVTGKYILFVDQTKQVASNIS